MIVLDTNVASEAMRSVPQPSLMAWLDAQPPQELWLCNMVVAELLYGVDRLPEGARGQAMADLVRAMLAQDFPGRVLPFDLEAAAHYADLVTRRERQGKPIAMADAQIAAICIVNGARLATRNARDFVELGVRVLDPWK